MDINSFSFSAFANQPPGYYTPTPGGMNTVYHNQAAGDLHTPGMAFHLGTPLSLPMADGSLHAGTSFDVHQGFNPEMFQAQAFHNTNPFNQHQTFPPSMLVHQDSGYEAIEGSPENDMDMSSGFHRESKLPSSTPQRIEGSMAAPPPPSAEKFRYHVTLNAPTAMIRNTEEIPVTYLNKGQAYTLSIVDNNPITSTPGPVKYRTVVRISFEDEQQRQRPSACWQLWKEGRGLAEAHQRGGKLQAVEYVDPHPGAEEDPRRPRIELESASFDCFAVTWTPSIATNTAECSVAVRFNFLSTDFSHSKGVKGIPVRLCAKTQMVSSGSLAESSEANSEVCYCKVKLFRDHGAERKLSNDVAHVKKTIDKLKQQISQLESGMKDFGKRKRTASAAGKVGGERPGKVLKHKRTWSISSQGSNGRPAIEEDLHQKLATVQDMFTSTRPVSVLYLKGPEQDDPDLFPVSLPGENDLSRPKPTREESWNRRQSGEISPTISSLDSPIPSSRSIQEGSSLIRSSTIKSSRQMSRDWPLSATLPATDFSAALELASSGPTNVKKIGDGPESEWIEAVGIDPSYVPPVERIPKPVACFYVVIKMFNNPPETEYYRAVYLMQRTLSDLISGIASKCKVDPARVERTLRVNPKGLKIMVDDEVVRETSEGQDMVVEFHEIEDSDTIKLEPGVRKADDLTPNTLITSKPIEMRLIY